MFKKWFGDKETEVKEVEFLEVNSLSDLSIEDTFHVQFNLLSEISDRTFTITDTQFYRLERGSENTVSVVTAESNGFVIRVSDFEVKGKNFIKIDQLISNDVTMKLFFNDDESRTDIRTLIDQDNITIAYKLERESLNGIEHLEDWTDETYRFPGNTGVEAYRSDTNSGSFNDYEAESMAFYFLLGISGKTGVTIEHFNDGSIDVYLSSIGSSDLIDEMIHKSM